MFFLFCQTPQTKDEQLKTDIKPRSSPQAQEQSPTTTAAIKSRTAKCDTVITSHCLHDQSVPHFDYRQIKTIKLTHPARCTHVVRVPHTTQESKWQKVFMSYLKYLWCSKMVPVTDIINNIIHFYCLNIQVSKTTEVGNRWFNL